MSTALKKALERLEAIKKDVFAGKIDAGDIYEYLQYNEEEPIRISLYEGEIYIREEELFKHVDDQDPYMPIRKAHVWVVEWQKGSKQFTTVEEAKHFIGTLPETVTVRKWIERDQLPKWFFEAYLIDDTTRYPYYFIVDTLI